MRNFGLEADLICVFIEVKEKFIKRLKSNYKTYKEINEFLAEFELDLSAKEFLLYQAFVASVKEDLEREKLERGDYHQPPQLSPNFDMVLKCLMED